MGDEGLRRQSASGLRERIDRLQPASEGEKRAKTFFLNRLERDFGRAALEGGQSQQAVDALRSALGHRAQLPNKQLTDRVVGAEEGVLLSLALASVGKADEARATIAPALHFLRETERRNTDDQALRVVLMQALYAAALTQAPAEARATLAEARAVHDALHDDLRGSRTVRWWHARIGEAQRTAR